MLILALIMSCGIVLIVTPPIVRVAKAKHLFDETNHRKVHSHSIPTLGGISLFMAITLTTAIVAQGYPFDGMQLVFAAMILLFFVGIKDDMIYIAPQTKFLIQFLAAFIIVALGGFSISSFEGLLGMHNIPPLLGQSFTVVFIVLMINAYNLIDGIDGLAGAMGIMASVIFGTWFLLNGHIALAIFSASIVGSLIGYLRFNVFGKQYKIFMGDTGSLLLGLIISLQVIWFLNFNLKTGTPYPINNAPVFALGLIALPLLDALRVFTVRIVRGLPPFTADKNHVHHRMLSFLPQHLHSSIGLTMGNVFVFVSALMITYTGLNINFQFFFILLLGTAMCIFPGVMERFLRKKNGHVKPILQPQNGFKLSKEILNLTYKGETVKFPQEKEAVEVDKN